MLLTAPTKKMLRAEVTRLLVGGRIYSTANIKSTDEYRMSIWWEPCARYCRFEDVSAETWERCRLRANTFIREIMNKWPVLASSIRYNFHIGSGIYLSLRVDNDILRLGERVHK